MTSITSMDKGKAGLIIAPNPFSQTTKIIYKIPLNANNPEIVITDLLGQKVASYNLKAEVEGEINFALNDLSHSLYLCHFICDGKIISVTKLVVIK